MKTILMAGALAVAVATPAIAQQAITRGDSSQSRSLYSQTQPVYGSYARGHFGGPMAYAPAPMAGPYMASGPYGYAAPGVDGAFNPGVGDQERSMYTQHAPIQGWPGDPQRYVW